VFMGVVMALTRLEEMMADLQTKIPKTLTPPRSFTSHQPPNLPRLELIPAASLTPAPFQWLWQDWLARGKFHVLAGAPGTGKTTLALSLAATVTQGGDWPDGTYSSKGNVLIWSGEDDPKDTLVPRLLASGADLSKVFFAGRIRNHSDVRAFDPAMDLSAILEVAESIGGIHLLIIDPIVSAIPGDSHKNAEVRRGLQPLVNLALALNCAALGISHFNKGSQGKDPTERITGSIAFGALARVVFAAAKTTGDHKEGNRIFCRTKSNIGPDDGGFRYDLEQRELHEHPGVHSSKLIWGAYEKGSARDLLSESDHPEKLGPNKRRSPQDEWLFDFLTYGQKTAKEVFEQGKAAGFSSDQIRRARERLNVQSSKHGYQGEWNWTLPEGTFQ